MEALSTPSFSQSDISDSDSLLIAVFIASVLHIVILLGINFSIPEPKKNNKQIEITIASTPTKKPPKKAKFLAQENQVGAGKESRKPTPPKQQLPSKGNSKKNKRVQQKDQPESKPKSKQKLVTQKQAIEKIASTKVSKTPPSEKQRPKLTAAGLQKQIAQLGAKIRHSQQSSENTKIKFINSVSTHQYIAAQYMKDWENKVERTGNLNYPKIARQQGFSGTLTMDVGINADGSIYTIRITKSSGIKALDDAAKRIVRLSAPFAALPKELLKQLDVLVIPRVWKFSDESGVTTR